MAIVILNVSDHDGSVGVSEYTVQINRGSVIARFEHWRGDGLATCLRRAADAVEASDRSNPHADKARSPNEPGRRRAERGT